MTFEENFLFETYKDQSFKSGYEFKKLNQKFKRADLSKVYREIVNYQIKKYGCQLKASFVDESNVIKENQKKRMRRKHYGYQTVNSKKRRWTNEENSNFSD